MAVIVVIILRSEDEKISWCDEDGVENAHRDPALPGSVDFVVGIVDLGQMTEGRVEPEAEFPTDHAPLPRYTFAAVLVRRGWF